MGNNESDGLTRLSVTLLPKEQQEAAGSSRSRLDEIDEGGETETTTGFHEDQEEDIQNPVKVVKNVEEATAEVKGLGNIGRQRSVLKSLRHLHNKHGDHKVTPNLHLQPL